MYELIEAGGRVRSRTHRAPVCEDIADGYRHDARRLWRRLQMPVLGLRAAHPLVGRMGFIVPVCDPRNFSHIALRATIAEVPANHDNIVMHDQTLAAIRGFLDAD